MGGCPLTALGLFQRQTSFSEWVAGGIVGLVLAALVWGILKPKSRSTAGLRLPPGSMGWPLLGETLHFLRDFSKSRTPSTPSFMQTRRELHGDIFKTRVLGLNAVFIGGPEAQKFIASNDGKLLESNCFASIMQQFGEASLLLANGDLHTRLRKAMQEPLSLGFLKARISVVESLTLDTLRMWEGKEVRVMEESTKFTFRLIMGMILSLNAGPELDFLWEQFQVFAKGGVSLPIKIPGTAFCKGLQARQVLINHFRGIIDSRRKSKIRSQEPDILDLLLKLQDVPAGQDSISDKEILDNLIFLPFAGYDTTANTLTTVISSLFRDPHHLNIVQAEHDHIRQGLQGDQEMKPLTWESLKQMTYTTQTIYEAIRMSRIGDFLTRRSLVDCEFQGYKIPKGWTVFLDRDSANFDTRTFKEPEKFNPARFRDGLPSNFSWTPFGGGPHMCIGMELGKLELCVFIHHLVTKYRWRILSDDFTFEHGGIFPVYRSGIPTVFERRQ